MRKPGLESGALGQNSKRQTSSRGGRKTTDTRRSTLHPPPGQTRRSFCKPTTEIAIWIMSACAIGQGRGNIGASTRVYLTQRRQARYGPRGYQHVVKYRGYRTFDDMARRQNASPARRPTLPGSASVPTGHDGVSRASGWDGLRTAPHTHPCRRAHLFLEGQRVGDAGVLGLAPPELRVLPRLLALLAMVLRHLSTHTASLFGVLTRRVDFSRSMLG